MIGGRDMICITEFAMVSKRERRREGWETGDRGEGYDMHHRVRYGE